MTATIERTPESVLRFWLGPLRSAADATEENWRERMLRWRVGVFARAFDDVAFEDAQRTACEQLHELGHARFFAPSALWDSPHGALAKLIVLDQFPRSVHRGTPLAYANDALTAPLIRHICAQGWDTEVYSVVERMWVYIALSHPEDRELQALSVDKWMRWSADLIAAAPPAHRRVNQRVGWSFVRSVIEHSEAVLLHGKFPHRNSILCRPHRAGEVHYLTSELRPPWSFTQPPRPDYYALHAFLHASEPRLDCRAIDRDTLRGFAKGLGLDDATLAGSVLDVFEVVGSERVGFHDLYRHLHLRRNAAVLDAMLHGPALAPQLKQITFAIFKDESARWPPRSARANVPKVIDVPALNLAIRCPLLDRGEVCVPRAAIDSFVRKTGFAPRPFSELFELYKTIVADVHASYELSSHGARRSVAIDQRDFARLARPLFEPSPAVDGALHTLYELLDLDYDGTVDAGEILVAFLALCSGSVDDKLHVCFQVFDADGSGYLDQDELCDLVHTTLLRGLHVVEALFRDYLPEGTRESTELVPLFSLASFAAIEQTAARALYEADGNRDGRVSEAEFTAWAGKHPLLRQLLTLSHTLFGA